MTIASYQVRKVSWLRWRWEIERNGRTVAAGYSPARRLAKRTARAKLSVFGRAATGARPRRSA